MAHSQETSHHNWFRTPSRKTGIAILSVITAIAVSLTGCGGETQISDRQQARVIAKTSIGIDCAEEETENTPTAAGDWNGGAITVEMIEACSSRQEYVDLVMPCYQFYASQYGIKFAGILALQAIYESGVPNNISNVMRSDNNMGGLKFSSSIPGATEGSPVPSNEGGRCYCRFESIDKYIGAAVWNIAHEGSPYGAAMSYKDSNIEYFAHALCSMWIGGYEPSDPPAPYGYSNDLLSDYKTYGLAKYEGGVSTSGGTVRVANSTSVTPAGGGNTELTGDDNETKCWNYLKTEGFTDKQAAGIMGNWYAESHFEPDILQGGAHGELVVDGTTGYGLAQWTYITRQQELQKFAEKKGKPTSDLGMQLEFFSTEFADSKEEYQKRDDIDECTRWFHNVYENSADDESGIQRRVSYAEEVYGRHAGQAVKTNKDVKKEECNTSKKEEKSSSVSAGAVEDIWWVQGGEEANGSFKDGSTLQETGCGLIALAVIISGLTGQRHTPNELASKIPEHPASTSELGFSEGYAWLEKDYGIKHEVIMNNTPSAMKEQLMKGRFIWVSGTGPFLKNDGTSWTSGAGHYIMFYKYENGTFYAQDCGNNQGKNVPYSESDLKSFLNGNHGGFAALYK